jgi:hypothetical protein
VLALSVRQNFGGEMMRPNSSAPGIGARVRIVNAGYDGQYGTVVAGTVWFNSESDHPGDRTVLLDSGQQLVFQVWMMRSLSGEF